MGSGAKGGSASSASASSASASSASASHLVVRVMVATCLCLGVAVLGAKTLGASREAEFEAIPALAMIDESALDHLATEASSEPVLLADLADGAGDALGGYAVAAGSIENDRWTIDLSGYDRAADRAAFGLLELGIEFSRDGDDYGILSGWGQLPGTAPADSPVRTKEIAERRLAAIIELGGTVTGRVFVADNLEQLETIERLAADADLGVRADGLEVWLSTASGHRRVAGWPYVCGGNIPVVGGESCDQADDSAASNAGVDGRVDTETFATLDRWLAATTGSLVPGSEQLPVASEGGVSWSNREAQQYSPELVTLTAEGLALTARLHSEPNVDRLPYDSGLVFSREPHGFGRFEFDVTVPTGVGLWPAIWMLDVEACDAPGRCPRYATEAYHEIDLLETAGDQLGYFSVHWFDDQIRSASSDQPVPAIATGERITVGLDRRPGVLQWSIDGQVVSAVAGPARSDRGIHRTDDMMLILNLAVGGSFSGDRVLGRSASWWGDAKVPDQFPDLGWTEAEFLIHELRITPL